ncbi:MAG TPA: DUF4912 domain-containing protein [Isosphaeraceae bacterium]|jgi:hypothetical protein|nr:DUF4912 domain-containing protein [Isosphaeraceae bacterium]
MRIALVGWDIDEARVEALGGVGVEGLVVWTRWHEGTGFREDRGHWSIRRCPHRLGGGDEAESWAFREAVLGRLDEPEGFEGDFDVVHALDPRARPAADGLAGRNPRAARLATVATTDLIRDANPNEPWTWVCEHPWVADRWRALGGAVAAMIPDRKVVEERGERAPGLAREEVPTLVAWVPRGAWLDVEGVVAAVATARGEVGGVVAVVLGTGPEAIALRRRLAGAGLLSRRSGAGEDAGLGRWNAAIAAATAVAVPGPEAADDPAAWIAWEWGKPVVPLLGRDPETLAEALRDAISPHPRRDRLVHAGAALARGRLDPRAVALGWLRTYLEAVSPAVAATTAEAPATWPAPARSRLALVPLGPHEAYASWHVRPDDRATALEWFGPDATRAVPVIRVHDITDLHFHGDNAHFCWDVELGPGESRRVLHVAHPGRSLAAALGFRSARGHFHPLAHAGPVHLPRPWPATEPPTLRLGALPRR